MPKKNSKKPQKNLKKVILKTVCIQLIAAAACLLIALIMKNSSVPFLKGCAESFGRAIRYDATENQSVKDVTEGVKSRFENFRNGVTFK